MSTHYELFDIGNDQTLVTYEDGEMSILTKEQLEDLKNSPPPPQQKILKEEFGEICSGLIEDYTSWREANISRAGERVQIRILKEKIKWNSKDVDYFGEYEIVGCESNEVKAVETIDVKNTVSWNNINIIYTSLLQLWFSGCHATSEDEQYFYDLMKKRR